MKRRAINNTFSHLGGWRIVDGVRLCDIAGGDDTQELHGIIVEGLEMPWNVVNENGEEYRRGCMDEFMERYFVKHELNVPIDVQHDSRPEWLVGRVIIAEDTDAGFKLTGFIPATIRNYSAVEALLTNGILQGWSKCGWASEYEFAEDGHMVVKAFDLLSMSLVTTPANALKFNDFEIKDATIYKRAAQNTMNELFNC